MLRPLIAVLVALGVAGLLACGTRSNPVDGPPPPPPPPPAVSGGFSATGMPSFDHTYGAAVRLTDGTVLVTGGGGRPESAELYDPATGQFKTLADMKDGRSFHTATLLDDGRVLVAGGGSVDPRSAEIYDPQTQQFSLTASMSSGRADHSAVLLQDGKVLMVGGSSDGVAELFDPTTDTFSSAGQLHFPRTGNTATKLDDGRVLVVGGYDTLTGTPIRTAEVYDASTASFSESGDSVIARYHHGAVLLGNGNVFIAAGASGTNEFLASSEILVGGHSVVGPSMKTAHARGTSTLLSSGRVLVAGGDSKIVLCGFDPCPASTDEAEIYDPAANSFIGTGNMLKARVGHVAVLLENGKVLIVGGGAGLPAELWSE